MGTTNHNTKLLKYMYSTGRRVCEFCGKKVVCVAMIRRRDRIGISGAYLTFRSKSGQVVTELIATVEHIRRRADGGGNGMRNVAVACKPCNQGRDARCREKRKAGKQWN